MKYLQLAPGSVTLLGVINDEAGAVEVIIDQNLWANDSFQCHPLVNTSTLLLGRGHLGQFFELTNHTPLILEVPAR